MHAFVIHTSSFILFHRDPLCLVAICDVKIDYLSGNSAAPCVFLPGKRSFDVFSKAKERRKKIPRLYDGCSEVFVSCEQRMKR